jgi:NADH-quinone oxidoreductase subunit H
MDSALFLEKLILIVVILAVTLVMALYFTFGERKIAAFFQDRLGPNRVGPFGLLQPFADGGKLLFKEEIIPKNAEKWLFILGPGIAMIVATITSAVIPWGTSLPIFGRTVQLQVADVNIGILYIMGIVSIGVYGIMIGGWASNNKFSLMGAVRAASQMVSYEIAMGLSMIALLMMTGTLSLKEISAQQYGFHWNAFYQPLSFLIFLICAFAETNRTPFDLAECESELIGGYHTEYSSMKMGFYLFAEYANMFISSTIIAVLFFGGYNYPGMGWALEHWGVNIANVIGIGALFAKLCFFIFFFMWIRWTIPRFRYDQLMNLGWKILIPLSIFNIIITGIVLLVFK